MTKQEAQNLYQKEFIQKQKEEIFPDAELPENYNLWKHAALNFCSPEWVRQNFVITWHEYKVLLMKEKNYNVYEMALINGALGLRIPNELDKLIEDNYYDVQDKVMALNENLRAIMKPHEETILKRIEIMSNQKGALPGRGGFKVINGRENN